MKSFALLFFVLTLFLSGCDREEETFLFDENDPEYELARQLALDECISDSQIFGEFDEREDFTQIGISVGDIFKISQDSNSPVEIFVYVNSLSSGLMELIYSSSNDSYDKIVTFETADHANIVSFLEQASCNEEYEDYFRASGLNGSTSMSFKWDLETINQADDDDDDNDDPEEYQYFTNELTVSKNFPLFFFYYNGKKTYEYVFNDGDDATTNESNITVTEVTDSDECDNGNDDQDDNCDFADLDSSGFPNCAIEVDDDAYLSRGYNTRMISLSGDSSCRLLVSGGADI